ncbi:phosphatase PAP2 family protein [Pseudonocardia sp. RS11V-5]|uniref:phosphatase PAP2 family protein n=1 Tax=Pseudonocardia terrae TaxID=2905831 RepID=UPI001E5FE3A7|nr:phosphatase PAP2 family protein [Pseudonocardia terrae]MCE3551375.1 phosphatase PAP2 family protein [Pseudonocardia terrae]
MDIVSGAAATADPVPAGAFGLPGPLNVSAFEQVAAWAAQTGRLHPVVAGFATYGVVVFAAFLVVNFSYARRTGGVEQVAAACWAPVGVLVAVGVNQAFVAAVHEPRPFTMLPQTTVLVARSTDYAFPSDHAVMAGATVAGLWLSARAGVRAGWLRWAGLVAALLMAFSRVYVGVHWPGDVVAGLVLGAAVALVGYLVTRVLLVAVLGMVVRTPVRPLFLPTTAATTGDGRNPGGPPVTNRPDRSTVAGSDPGGDDRT